MSYISIRSKLYVVHSPPVVCVYISQIDLQWFAVKERYDSLVELLWAVAGIREDIPPQQHKPEGRIRDDVARHVVEHE